MYVYTIQKNDLYKVGIEPTCSILESSCENYQIVFDESQIPNIVASYHNLCKDTAGEAGEKLRTMRLSLKTIEQKISNIDNVIANTGSVALANQLML